MSNQRVERLVLEAFSQQHAAGDFSFVEGRMIEDGFSWDYSGLANERLGSASAAGELCTGVGELSSAANHFSDVMYATEPYKPNLSIAKTRLCSLAVQALAAGKKLPADPFNLVLNRYGCF